MEVFMQNIAYAANRVGIIAKIAAVVHGPPYAPFNEKSLLNFEVYLHHPRKTRTKNTSNRTGTVTFPSREIGEQFLRDCAGTPPRIPIEFGSQTITFRVSRNAPRPQDVENLQRMPFIDPRILEEREAMLQDLNKSMPLSGVQFGWQCRDEVFSVEWERLSKDERNWQLNFDGENRILRLTLEKHPSACLDSFAEYMEEMIVIYFSQITQTYASATSRDNTIFIELRHAPVFELKLRSPLQELLTESDRPPKRLRKGCLPDDDHKRVVPFVSFAMRLLCESNSDKQNFRRLWGIARVGHRITDGSYCIERRNIFSKDSLDELQSWLNQLGWPIGFHVDALVRGVSLDPKELLSLRPELHDLMAAKSAEYVSDFLRYFRIELDKIWYSDDSQSRESVKESFNRALETYRPSSVLRTSNTSEDLFECLHVSVTPTRIFLDGPFPERTNRIIRRYAENASSFLRVAFMDESRLQFRFDRDVDGRFFIDERVGGILREGLVVGGRKFDFLAYSQSALKDHAVWFVNEFWDKSSGAKVSAKTIIRDIGSFDQLAYDGKLIFCPARYAARLSQAFTATDVSTVIEAEEIIIAKDIERNGCCFTDGVGMVSSRMADEIWQILCAKKRRGFGGKRPLPRAFQIRFQGSKGMVSVDYKQKGRVLVLRPSMIKFESPNSSNMEIAGVFNKPGKMYLNRPLIMLLEGLGVPAEVFLKLQRLAISQTEHATRSMEGTAMMFESHGLGTSYRLASIFQSLAKLGCTPKDPFHEKVVEYSIFHILRELKHRARIPVPGGWTLVGVADVHSYLEEGEVFICIEEEKDKPEYLEGLVSISRSPTIHPGDVQIARAIGAPPPESPFAKERLQNTLVFSTKGQRSLPSKLGGGDLDGDVYNVTDWQELHPRRTSEAASYEPAQRKQIDRPSTMDDVIDFVVEYMVSDNLGIIASRWLIAADQTHIEHPDCLTLAKLHSDAVDYPKSGMPVAVEKIPRPRSKTKPDWSAPETDNSESQSRYYPSAKALGRLFRDIELPRISTTDARGAGDNASSNTVHEGSRNDEVTLVVRKRVAEFVYNMSISRDQESNLQDIFWRYALDLQQICFVHSLSRKSSLSEEEAVIGVIIAQCSQLKMRKDHMSRLREHTAQLVSDVRFDLAEGDRLTNRKRLRRAWAGWEMSLRMAERPESRFAAQSFKWVTLGAIFDAIKSIEDEERRNLADNVPVYPLT